MEEINMIDAVFGKDGYSITYRPDLNHLTGSVISTIILSQIIYWWKKAERSKFYKFKEACSHPMYKHGDSWCEELGLTREEFDSGIKKICFKLGKNKNIIKKEDAIILSYTDSQRLTWYEVNEDLLSKVVSQLYLVKRDSHFTKNRGIPTLLVTESTTEITTEKEKDNTSINTSIIEKESSGDWVEIFETKNEIYQKLVSTISTKYKLPIDRTEFHLDEFYMYWTDITAAGVRRWVETEIKSKVQFNLLRRLYKWFNNQKMWSQEKQSNFKSNNQTTYL